MDELLRRGITNLLTIIEQIVYLLLYMKQIQLVELLIRYVVQNGTIDRIALTENPFRALGEVGNLFEDKANIFM